VREMKGGGKERAWRTGLCPPFLASKDEVELKRFGLCQIWLLSMLPIPSFKPV
jgi:hypothetical protein